jgi:hypothetical protein
MHFFTYWHTLKGWILAYNKLLCLSGNILFIYVDPNNAFLKNWLANLSGKVNGFKEMDLLQEHQNFWAKVCSISLCPQILIELL